MSVNQPPQPTPVGGATDIALLWKQLRSGPCDLAREQIIDVYLPFARTLAAQVYAKRTYLELEFFDYFQYASIGLMEAVDHFDGDRGVKFETFAASRITGAILSGIKSLSEKQEQVNARRRLLSERVTSMKTEPPDDKDPDAIFVYLAELAIGLAIGFVLEDTGMHQLDDSAYPDNTYQRVEMQQLNQRVRASLDAVSGKGREVLSYHYLQQISFEEIATMLGITRGRVSQIHVDTLNKLRTRFFRNDEMDLYC